MQDDIRVSVGLCFVVSEFIARGVSRRRSRLRRSAIFGRSDGAALRAAFGVGQRSALPWCTTRGAGQVLGLGFEVLELGFDVLGLGFEVPVLGFEVLWLGFTLSELATTF